MTMEARSNEQQALGSPILRLMSALREKKHRRRSSCPPPVDTEDMDSNRNASAEVSALNESARKSVERRASAPTDYCCTLPTSLSSPTTLEVSVSGGKVVTRRRPSTVSSCPVTPRKKSTSIPEREENIVSVSSSRLIAPKMSLSLSTPPPSLKVSAPAVFAEQRSYSLSELDQRQQMANAEMQMQHVVIRRKLSIMPLRRCDELHSLPTSGDEAQVVDGRIFLSGSQRPDCPIRFPLRCVGAPEPPSQGMRQLSVC